MNPTLFPLLVFAASWIPVRQEPIQFLRGTSGQTVTIWTDGLTETTFAGKLGFQDGARSWTSVCADASSPISGGQTFQVGLRSTSAYGGNVALAGNIVARYFKAAQTPAECAGLQLAVWKALADGSSTRDFSQGHFQARATTAAMFYAQQYIQGEDDGGDAVYFQVPGGGQGGQSQISD